jgi:hypothetical protein
MAEYVPRQGQIEGHHPNVDTAMLELQRLLAIFLSSEKFADLRKDDEGESFDPISHLESLQEDELTRILLALAITARVIDDRSGMVVDKVAGSCGLLQTTNPKGEELIEELSLRETCNKIIHAKNVRFDLEHTKSKKPYLGPFIYLHGELRGNQWKATLDVIAFAKEYCSYFATALR